MSWTSDGASQGCSVGFIGLGRMGEPMALNLLRAGRSLHVWNRSQPALDRLRSAGAAIADGPGDVLRSSAVTILMLANEQATDQVLARSTADFAEQVSARTLVNMGTTSPGYSRALASDVRAAGGRYVEAPVSGSRGPAEKGELVGMLAGEAEDVELARELVEPMCGRIFGCGAVPNALTLKLAVNLYLITMVAGLAEAVHFADCTGVDQTLFRAVLDSGPMASAVSRAKLEKLAAGDFSPQASIGDVWMNSRLVADAARQAGAASPLLDRSEALFGRTHRLGHADLDMIAVVRGLQALSEEQGVS